MVGTGGRTKDFMKVALPYDECEKIVRAQVQDSIRIMRETSLEDFDPDIKIDKKKREEADKKLEDKLTRQYLIMLNREGLVDLGMDTPQPG
jgi:hypothetical protein